jgi:hypothetical protein
MSLTQAKWPKDLDPDKSPYPKWSVLLANRSRFRSRFWLSPVGLGLIALLTVVFLILNEIQK